MPSLKKLLSKFSREEREIIESLIEVIISLSWRSLDIKKLKGELNIFRVSKGNLRILYQIRQDKIFILTIERRREKTYKRL